MAAVKAVAITLQSADSTLCSHSTAAKCVLRYKDCFILCAVTCSASALQPLPLPEKRKRNPLSEEKKEEFHKAMKKSVVKKRRSLPTNEINVAQQMKEFDATIFSSSRQKVYIY